MRVVADTNLLLSALIYRGLPGRFLLALEDTRHSLLTSPRLLAELEDVIFRPKFKTAITKTGATPQALFDGFISLATVVKATTLAVQVSRDRDDDAVLACALAANADMIASGDDDLLVLQSFEGIPIVTARVAIERLNSV
jgi:uncharacterized protein